MANEESRQVILQVCRTCMWHITDETQMVHIDSIPNPKDDLITIRNKLNGCIPELHLDGRLSTYICNDCATALDFVYKFRQKCLDTEKLIGSYLKERSVIRSVKPNSTEEGIQQPHLEIVDSSLVLLNTDSIDDDDDDEVVVQDTDGTTDDVQITEAPNDENWLPAYTVPENNPDTIMVIDDESADSSTPKPSSATQMPTKFSIIENSSNFIRNYKCKICQFITTSKVAILGHVKGHKSYRRLVCKPCRFTTAVEAEMVAHLKSKVHSNVYKCAKCSFTTKVPTELVKHIGLENEHSTGCDGSFLAKSVPDRLKKIPDNEPSDVICLD